MLSDVICIGYSLQKNNMNSSIKKKKKLFFSFFLKKTSNKFGGFIFLCYLCNRKENN